MRVIKGFDAGLDRSCPEHNLPWHVGRAVKSESSSSLQALMDPGTSPVAVQAARSIAGKNKYALLFSIEQLASFHGLLAYFAVKR